MPLRTKLFFIFSFLFLLAGIAVFSLKYYTEKIEEEKRQKAMKENILEGVAAVPEIVKVNYSKKIADGSSLIFGGSHSPPTGHDLAWDEFKNIGITTIRKDLYVEFTLPRNITISDYQNNVNDVQNPANWDPKTIPALKEVFKNAKKRGIKVIGIMGYAPRWLTYNNSPFGVPRNWEVFHDIVKKIYTLYRDDLDYVEVWNEPDHRIFLVTQGSNMTKPQAYTEIYYQATNAIREVDKEKNDGKIIPFIAPAESNPRVSNILEPLVTNKKINILPDAYSFHTYDSFIESFTKYKNIGKNYNDPPIFITEWNMESRNAEAPQYKTGIKALTFTSSRLMDYLNNGVGGANYFALLPINTTNRGTDENTMGFYSWINNKPELLPQAKSWRLLSKSLGLGKGKSTIVETSIDNLTNSVGFINSDEIKGTAVVNDSDESQLIEFQLINSAVKKRARIEVYVASEDYNGGSVVSSRMVYPENGILKFRYFIPGKSVVGIKMHEEKEWYDFLDAIEIKK